MSISWADQCTAGGECAVPEPLTGHCPNMRSQRTVVIDVEHPLHSSSRAAVRPSRRDRSAAQALDDDWHHRCHHRKAPPPPGRGPIRPSDPTTRKPGPVSLQEPRSQSRWHLHAGQSLPSTTEPTHEVRLISTYSVCAFWRGLLAATRFGCVAGPHLKCDGGTPDGRLGVISITPRRQIVSE
jgi:hypothetical protein